MIFDAKKEKDAVQVGEIQKNKVSIDTNNIDFIVTILSTNLYSDTIGSFIRETVSNAWDSHKEANVDTPVILELGTDVEGNHFCRVQDFGVGLSPERFNKIYRNIGSSTKRTSNEQIGGFGIGRFSALAYSDIVYITSIFDGVEYIYLMYKDGNSISIDLLNEKETTEGNGVEVKVPVKQNDLLQFKEAIKGQLVYFENLYVTESLKENLYLGYGDENLEEVYNNFKVKKYKNFWVNNLNTGDYTSTNDKVNIILGKVCYPLRIDNLDKDYLYTYRKYPISLLFDIGDLSVTPNREEVLYSSANKKIIEEKFDAALKEISEIQAVISKQNYTKIPEYIQALKTSNYLELIEGVSPIEVIGAESCGATLNGVKYDTDKFKKLAATFFERANLHVAYTLNNGKITYSNNNITLLKLVDNFHKTFICQINSLKNITKSYIRDVFEDGSLFIQKSNNPVYKILKSIMYVSIRDGAYDKEIFKLLIDNVFTNLKKLETFSDQDVPQSWKDARAAKQKASRKLIKTKGFDWTQEVNLYVLRKTEHGNNVTSDSEAVKLKGLDKKYKNLVIYGEKDSESLKTLFSIFENTHKYNTPKVVAIAPTKLKLLSNIKNFINEKDFMKSANEKMLRNIGTVSYLNENIPMLCNMRNISNLNEISENLSKIIEKLYKFHYDYKNTSSWDEEIKEAREIMYDICKEHDYFNEEIRSLYLSNKKEIDNLGVICNLLDCPRQIKEEQINPLVDYLLARKLIKPNHSAVLKLKKETIYYNIEENENN